MRAPALLPVLCLIALPAAAQQEGGVSVPSPDWTSAISKMRHRVDKRGGAGAVILIERIDTFTLHLKVELAGAKTEQVNFSALRGEFSTTAFTYNGKKTEYVEGTARLNEVPSEMLVELSGDDFHPRVRMRIPRRGERPEVVSVVVGDAPKEDERDRDRDKD